MLKHRTERTASEGRRYKEGGADGLPSMPGASTRPSPQRSKRGARGESW